MEPYPATRHLLSDLLQQRGFTVGALADVEAASVALQREPWGLVVVDGALTDGSTERFCRRVRASGHSVLVAVTSLEDADQLQRLVDAGVDELLVRPLDHRIVSARLQLVARRVAERVEAARCRDLTRALEQRLGHPPSEWVALAAATDALAEQMRLAALSDAPVLLSGEAGSGKEFVARTVHARSARRAGPFVVLDPTAATGPALDALLCGTVNGVEGATHDRPGLMELADGGTLFIDEVAGLPVSTQRLLLQLMRDRSACRMGSSVRVGFDVRIMAATRQHPDALADGLRDDLYWALRVFDLRVPALRERREDLAALAQRLLEDRSRNRGTPDLHLTRGSLERLLAWQWPGNVRELRNVLDYAAVACTGDRILAQDLPGWLPVREAAEHPTPPPDVAAHEPVYGETGRGLMPQLAPPRRPRRPEDELQLVLEALKRAGGVRSTAADLLGISRVALWKKMKRLGVEYPSRAV